MKRYIRAAVGLAEYEAFLQNNDYEGLLYACIDIYNELYNKDNIFIKLRGDSVVHNNMGECTYVKLSELLPEFIDVVNDPDNDYMDFSDPFYWAEAVGVAICQCPFSW